MNNLKEKGFDLLKNQPQGLSKGLQGEEIHLYLKSLGSFHASTHHLIQQEGGVQKILSTYPSLIRINPLKKDILNIIEKSIHGSIDNAIDIAKDYMDHETSEKLINFKPKSFQIFKKYFFESCKNAEGEYQTITHGDAWQNNAMFR